ncbi:MAG: hypothetical protein GY943_20210 [Chloroflexi bacterium]|nr:hypothetical protein [Chloroflexota bacterium]
MPDYKRQYFGIVQDDTHLVYGNFFCDDFGVDWRETAVVVDDGGDCYFQLTYNPELDEFLSLHINGES